MRLPSLLVLTDRSQCAAPLREVVAGAVGSGARAVVLREKDLAEADRAQLAEELWAVLEPVGGVLILAGTAPLNTMPLNTVPPNTVPSHTMLPYTVSPHNAVHLSAGDVFPLPRPSVVGRSCHTADECRRAAAQGCDYVTVSPVFATASKPGYGPALGVDGLARLSHIAPPMYALGGVHPRDVAACLDSGACGVAVMGPVMRDPGTVAAYLAALPRLPGPLEVPT